METGHKKTMGNVLADPVTHYVSRSLQPESAEANGSELLRPENLVDIGERVVIVCGEPGMGKSTLMTHLGKATKEAHPHLWVVSIALSDHTRLLSERKYMDAAEFLLAASRIKSPFRRSTFKHDLKVTGNVVVILDGVDQLAPAHVGAFYQLLHKLRKTKAKKIWIATRNSVKETLELDVSTSVTRLGAFSEEDLRCFFKQYWTYSVLESKKEGLPEEELDDFISQLLKMTSWSIEDNGHNFLGCPLHAQIIAEVFVDHITSPGKRFTLPETLDLLQLLELIVEKKLDVYVQSRVVKKQHKSDYVPHLHEAKTLYLNNLKEFALRVILSDIGVDALQLIKISDLSKFLIKLYRGGDKTGFINISSNSKPRFKHRVYTAYFAAMWFAEHLPEYTQLIGKEKNHRYFASDPTVARLLCDLILAKNCPLNTAVLNRDFDKVDALLKAGADVNARDRVGRTPLHLTAPFGCRSSAGGVKHDEILDLLIQVKGIDVHVKDTELINGSPFQYAAMYRHVRMMDTLLAQNLDSGCLDTTEVKFLDDDYILDKILLNGLDSLMAYCWDNYPYFHYKLNCSFTSILVRVGQGELANSSLSVCHRIVKMLTDRGHDIDGPIQPGLHTAAQWGHLDVVKLLMRNASVSTSSPNDEQTRSDVTWFVNRTAERGRIRGWTALHSASAHGHTEVAAFLIANGADIAAQDGDGQTCLHFAASSEKNGPDLVQTILGCLTEATRPAFVGLSDGMGSTALHCAAYVGCLETVTLLVDAGGRMSSDDRGRTPLMEAAREGHLAVVRYLLAAFDGECDSAGVKWIDSTDENGWSALYWAFRSGFKPVAMFLIAEGADTSAYTSPNPMWERVLIRLGIFS